MNKSLTCHDINITEKSNNMCYVWFLCSTWLWFGSRGGRHTQHYMWRLHIWVREVYLYSLLFTISHANLMYLYGGLKQWSVCFVCLSAYCYALSLPLKLCFDVLISSFWLYGFLLVCLKDSVPQTPNIQLSLQNSASAILLCGITAVFVVKYLGMALYRWQVEIPYNVDRRNDEILLFIATYNTCTYMSWIMFWVFGDWENVSI